MSAEIAANDSQGQAHCIPFLSFGAILKFYGGFDNAVIDFEKLKSFSSNCLCRTKIRVS